MIPEDGILFGPDGAENFGAAVSGMASGDERERAARYKVAGNENKIWSEIVDPMDDMFQKERLCEFVEVNVRQLDDAETVKGVGKVGNANGRIDDVDLVASDLT